MSKLAKSLAAVPFAHLLGIGARAESEDGDNKDREEKEKEWAVKAESDPEREREEDESDAEYAARMEEMDEAEEREKSDEEDEEDEDEKKGHAKSKARADDDGDDADAEGEDDKKHEARRAERARCARIIAAGIKVGAVHQACVFAFDTGMSSRAAVAALQVSKLDAKGGLAGRMASTSLPTLGAGGAPAAGSHEGRAAQQAASIIRAVAAVRGRK